MLVLLLVHFILKVHFEVSELWSLGLLKGLCNIARILFRCVLIAFFQECMFSSLSLSFCPILRVLLWVHIAYIWCFVGVMHWLCTRLRI